MKKQDSAGKLAALILAGLLLIGAGAVYTADVTARGKAIGTEYAVQFARIDAGVDAENVVEQKATLVRKQGGYVYNVDFSTETGSFACVVRASDGVILEREGDFEKAVTPTPEPDAGKDAEAKPTPIPGTGGETALIPTPSGSQTELQNSVSVGKLSSKTETAPITSAEADSAESAAPVTSKAVTPSAAAAAPRNYIGVDKAKALAAEEFGFTASEVTFSTAKLENENGEVIYDLEFFTSKAGYECEIHALTGEVLEKSVEQFAAEAETDEAVSEAVVADELPVPEPAAEDTVPQTPEDDSAYDDDEVQYDEDEQDEDSDRYEEEHDDDDWEDDDRDDYGDEDDWDDGDDDDRDDDGDDDDDDD